MSIETKARISEFFLESVEGACRNQRVEASPSAQAYVAGLLEDFVRPDANAALRETLERPLTLVLDEAMQTSPTERFEKLKGLGDGTLYVSGFFGESLERRGVDDEFVASIGGFAYRSAAGMLRGPQTTGSAIVDIFAELAARFAAFVQVLAEIAETTSFAPRTPSSTLRLYEKWLRTGSDRLARELAAQGVTPLKPGLA
jgi:hypothetical protein